EIGHEAHVTSGFGAEKSTSIVERNNKLYELAKTEENVKIYVTHYVACCVLEFVIAIDIRLHKMNINKGSNSALHNARGPSSSFDIKTPLSPSENLRSSSILHLQRAITLMSVQNKDIKRLISLCFLNSNSIELKKELCSCCNIITLDKEIRLHGDGPHYVPEEPPPLDDLEVDDWLHALLFSKDRAFSCICVHGYKSTRLTLLFDVVEVGHMPCHTQEAEETQYRFYIVTRHGLRYECSSASKLQLDAWVETLQDECKLRSNSTARDHLPNT
ncbi:hypothetical protein M8C21_017445, partial [Ambrosia artemisiifolia]